MPSRTVRPAEILETKPNKLNTTKKFKTKRKNKLSAMENTLKNNIDMGKDQKKNMMNSNRVIEPFSPTFEHPDDFLPSNQTSFRPLAMAKYGKNLEKHYKDIEIRDNDSNIIPSVIFEGTDTLKKYDSRGTGVRHQRTQSSNNDTIDFDKLKHTKETEAFRETGKFINPLVETSEITSKQKSATRRLADSNENTRKSRRRPKTGNGRYSRRGKGKNKSEERRDKKRMFSKSVDQSYHGDSSSAYQHDLSILKKISKIHEEEYLNGEEVKHSIVSPHHKIHKLIKESLKKKKENETIKIIEQILKEEDNLLKKEELEKLNKEVRKTNRRKFDVKKKKKGNKKNSISDTNHNIKLKSYNQTREQSKSKDK